MRKVLLAAAAALSASGAASAQGLSVAAALSPRALPSGVSIPTIASNAPVYPGCPLPPTSYGHVWHFADAAHGGLTQTAGGDGSLAHPWDNPNALFGAKISGTPSPIPGYSTILLNTVPGGSSGPVSAGDEILLNGSFGAISAGYPFNSDQQIINSPALTFAPEPGDTATFASLTISGGTGFVFNGFNIQSLAAGSFLVLIQDDHIGVANSNIVFENMNISSAPIATALTWNAATWQANAGQGISFSGSNNGANLTCASIVNSHVFVVRDPSNAAIFLGADDSLAQNNQVDYVSNSGIGYQASGVAILGNTVQNIFNAGYGDSKAGVQGYSFNGAGVAFSNITISRNKITQDIDAALPPPPSFNGIVAYVGDWTNVSIYDNLIASSGNWSINAGNVHNGIIANNSTIDGKNTAEENGQVLQLFVGQSDQGTAGHSGLISSNVRVTNNIAPTFQIFGSNVQADNNIATSTYTGIGIWLFSYYGGFGNIAYAEATPGTITNAPNAPLIPGAPGLPPTATVAGPAIGTTNYLDGLDQQDVFTAVPMAGSVPMSPAPNWAPVSGSLALTLGGATLVPPFTDFNGTPFSGPPYVIGALAAPPTFSLPTGDVVH
jgi:hypothetical protein